MALFDTGRPFFPRGAPARIMEDSKERTDNLRCGSSCKSGMQSRGTLRLYLLIKLKFVDPLILMRVIKTEAQRRIAWLIAEKSMKRKFIGAAAGLLGPVTVGRALDSTKPGTGKIYLPDPKGDPFLIRGNGTNFEKEAEVGGLLVLPTVNGLAANAEIAEVHGPEEIRLKKEFKGDVAFGQLTGQGQIGLNGSSVDGAALEAQHDFQGTSYKTAPKVDQTEVYNAVFDRLSVGGCIGIFPEGGSHDRPELLPLKGYFERVRCNH